MEYIIINKKTGKRTLQDTYVNKKTAQQCIVDIIRNAYSRKQALKYYQELRIKS